jgi:hypothetical protein
MDWNRLHSGNDGRLGARVVGESDVQRGHRECVKSGEMAARGGMSSGEGVECSADSYSPLKKMQVPSLDAEP